METRCIIYARSAAEGQAEAGPRSISEQIVQCREFATHRGWQVVSTIQETGPALNLNERPELKRVRQMVMGGEADTVLVLDPTRLSRNPNDLIVLGDEWGKVGARWAVVTA